MTESRSSSHSPCRASKQWFDVCDSSKARVAPDPHCRPPRQDLRRDVERSSLFAHRFVSFAKQFPLKPGLRSNNSLRKRLNRRAELSSSRSLSLSSRKVTQGLCPLLRQGRFGGCPFFRFAARRRIRAALREVITLPPN